MKATAREMRDDIQNIKALLFLHAPFLAILLSRMRILVNEDVRSLMVTPDGDAIFNPGFWRSLPDTESKTFVLLHEALHLGFRHPWLVKGRDRKIYNLATDMVINEMLFRHGYNRVPGNPVTAPMIQMLLRESGVIVSADELRRASSEEVYRLLSTPRARDSVERNVEDNPDDLSESPPDPEGGEEVQSGAVGETDDPEQRWRGVVNDALITAHQAGMLPADIKRRVEMSLKPEVNWRRTLRGCIQEGAGRMVVSTWLRSSRRYASFPGIKRLGVQTVWALIDCSGSIPDEILARFSSELWSLTRLYGCILNVIPWDAKAYPAVRVFSAYQARHRLSEALRGGGGTVLGPALIELSRRLRTQDMVVILSDGYIADIEAKDTLALYRRITRRAARVVFVTAGRAPSLPNTRTIQIY